MRKHLVRAISSTATVHLSAFMLKDMVTSRNEQLPPTVHRGAAAQKPERFVETSVFTGNKRDAENSRHFTLRHHDYGPRWCPEEPTVNVPDAAHITSTPRYCTCRVGVQGSGGC